MRQIHKYFEFIRGNQPTKKDISAPIRTNYAYFDTDIRMIGCYNAGLALDHWCTTHFQKRIASIVIK